MSKGRVAFLVTLGVLLVIGLITFLDSFTIVRPKHFGVGVELGAVNPNILDPGWHWRNPWISDILSYNNNTIIMESTVGLGNNTKDQNAYTADMRVHYNISPNVGILAFHLKDMQDEDGHDLLVSQMDKAMNAVVGQRPTVATLVAPEDVLKAFLDQLEWRLSQNNIAIKIDTVEMLTQYVGGALRLPVQLKIKPGNEVESMAGPSVPVQHLMIVSVPDDVTRVMR
jgi:regulator of protease activity HflC (stomatin/prohibitin superfamily)